LSLSGTATLCVRLGDAYHPVSPATTGLPGDMAGFLAAGAEARSRLEAALAALPQGAGIPAAAAHYLPLLTAPGKIVCLGLNYTDHAAEGGFAKPDYPAIFLRTPSSLVAHGADLIRPLQSEQVDYEVELAVIIGRRTRRVPIEDALCSVAGYSVFNDGSVRDYQFKSSQWTVGKNFDGTGSFGPEFVSADALPAGAKGLRVTTRLNGTLVQDADTADMIFDVATTIAMLSECMTLEVGDVIVMGTPSGVGFARTPQLWMKPGDVCECAIEGIGALRNPIAQEKPVGMMSPDAACRSSGRSASG
jgi:2-keto-4-pentenoate hydratase/2-oxohepta-3-ene-1,7-dioic acid hydratase in catechol pathway